MTHQEFIESIAGYVKKYAPSYGIYVHSPIIAQAVLESGWGSTRLAAEYHNYHGLKCGTRWTGKSVNLTNEGRVYARHADGNPGQLPCVWFHGRRCEGILRVS